MTWTNWAGRITAQPATTGQPADTAEVAALVRAAAERGQRVKMVGAGHSFTPIAVTDGVLLQPDRLVGPVLVDLVSRRVRVRAGTRLQALNPLLESLGLALPNLGDIDRQSIAGAISTGTHGTGLRLNGIASAVVGLTLVTGDGTVLTCSADEHPEIFAAARVGLGAVGVLTEVELQCVPAFRLNAREDVEDIDGLLAGLDADLEANDHVDVMWFPHTSKALVKRNNRASAAGPPPLRPWRAWLDDELLANEGLALISNLSAALPRQSSRLNRLSTSLLSAREYTDASWKVFCSTRRVRFVESEYAVPLASVSAVVAELQAWFKRSRAATPIPVELRFLGPDDVWLSPGYQRVNAFVAVHQYHRMDEQPLFDAFGAIVAEHQGRPHWGKLHRLDAATLAIRYPRFTDFLAVRDQVDPDRRFSNPYLERVLGS